jgi:hypothetical protein
VKSDQIISAEDFGAMIDKKLLPPSEATMTKISIYRIAANPNEFHGQAIKTSGILGRALDMPNLGFFCEVYFSTVDFREEVVENRLLIRVPDDYRHIFEENKPGVRFTFAGTFSHSGYHPLHSISGLVYDLIWVDFMHLENN